MTENEPVLNFATQIRTGRAPVWTKEVVKLFDMRGEHSIGDKGGGQEELIVSFLEGLARGGPALELAIGSGRIGLPLAERGIAVDGIDNSPAMVAKLREKPGGDRIAVTIGDYADVGVEGRYRLIFLVANTLSNLLTQENQIRCFENVAKHLTDDGVFVVEAGSPAWLYGLPNQQYVEAEALDVNYVALDTAKHDPVNQTLEEVHVILTKDRVRLFPIVTRYVWPSEMDLMARLAGLRLIERYGGWSRESFTSDPQCNCISVYGF